MLLPSVLLQQIERAEYDLALREIERLAPDINKLKPLELQALLKLYNRLQWIQEGKPIAEKLMELNDLDQHQMLEVGCFHVLLGKPEVARKLFLAGVKKVGSDPLLISEIAFTYEQQGNKARATELLAKLVVMFRKQGKVDECLLRVLYRLAGLRALLDDEFLFVEKLLRKARNAPSPVIDHVVRLLHVLAIHARKLNDDEREIDLLLEANALAKQRETAEDVIWTQRKAEETLNLIRKTFPVARPDWLPPLLDPDQRFCEQQVVFILGMPRSGTTLVEQIVGAHSSVGNSGESLAFGVALDKALKGLGGLLERGEPLGLCNLRHLRAEGLQSVGERYLGYQRLLTDADVISDKQLVLVDFVGILANLFPKAQFVCVQRDPLDNCVSLMQKDFRNAPFSNDPLHIVQEGELYRKRMEYWQSLFPERVHFVSYEALTRDPGSQMKALIAAAGLEWEGQITEFYKRDNSVRTPSVSQVRSAINTEAVEKWRRYQRLIQPAIEYLGR